MEIGEKLVFVLAASLFLLAAMNTVSAISMGNIELTSIQLSALLATPLVLVILGSFLIYKGKSKNIGRVLFAFATIISFLGSAFSAIFILLGTVLTFNKKYQNIGLILALIGAAILAVLILIIGVDINY